MQALPLAALILRKRYKTQHETGAPSDGLDEHTEIQKYNTVLCLIQHADCYNFCISVFLYEHTQEPGRGVHVRTAVSRMNMRSSAGSARPRPGFLNPICMQVPSSGELGDCIFAQKRLRRERGREEPAWIFGRDSGVLEK